MAGTQVIILDEIQSEFIPDSLAKHTNPASARWINLHTWRSYFEYFASWVVSADWRVVYFQKVDPRTKDKSLSDSAATLHSFTRLCVEPDQGHTPFNSSWLCWHSQSHSFLWQLSGLCTLYAFLLGTWSSHSSRQEKLAPEQKEARTRGLPKITAMGLAHINEVSFTFSRALLLVFQGHLHLRGLKHFFLTLIFALSLHPALPLLPYTISRAWALQKEIKLWFGMLNYLN